MGTYEQPAIIPPADMTEGLKQMRAGTQALLAGAQAGAKQRAAREAKERAIKDKEAKERHKIINKISTNFDQNNFGQVDIDTKFDYFTEQMLYAGYQIQDKDLQNEYYKTLVTKSKNTLQLITYMNNGGDQLSDMYTISTDINGNKVYQAKGANVDGANLNTNDGVMVDCFIDYKVHGGKHGEFFNADNQPNQKGKFNSNYGYKYFYPMNQNGERVSWQDFDASQEGQEIQNKVDQMNNSMMKALNTNQIPNHLLMTTHKYMMENPNDPSIQGKYKVAEYPILANDINPKIASGDKFFKQFNLDSYNKRRTKAWNSYGKVIYNKYDKSAFTSQNKTISADGTEITSKVVNYDIANKGIETNYMANAYNLGIDQNVWQGLGFSGIFDPSTSVDAAGMNDTYRAAAKMAQLDIQNLAKKNFGATEMKADESALKKKELTNNLPGLPGTFNLTKQVSGPNGTMQVSYWNPIDGTTLAGKTVSSGAGTFGNLSPGKGGYSFADYVTIATELVPGVNAGNLENFAGILTSMSAVNGREYEYGSNLRSKYHRQFTPEALEDISAQTGLSKSQLYTEIAQDEEKVLIWASGETFKITVSGTEYTVAGKEEGYGGLKDIDEGGFYRTSGSYFNKLPVNDPYSALSLLLYESDISKANSTYFLAEFNKSNNPQNLQNQKNANAKSQVKPKINTQTVYTTLIDAQNAAGPNEKAISDGKGGFVITIK
tara:strand:+ start:707 stop:2857 length:2151 start_codon:yes stop_codon:yes gene_type:complete